jgi:hypothetical protein
MDNLEGVPAVFYTAPWLVRELGFLKTILDDLKIDKLKILFFFEDYKPGGLISIDGEKGDYSVIPVDDVEGVEYDGALFGKLQDLVSVVDSSNMILSALWLLIKGKVKVKGLGKLLKFARFLLRCI